MNTFVVLVGASGVGKTSFVSENSAGLTNKYGIDSVLSSDAVIEDIAHTRGLTYSEVFKDSINLATKYVESLIGILSLQQRSFVLDQTNLTVKSRQRKLNLLVHPQNYHRLAVVFDNVSYETLLHRVKSREGKEISEELLKDMLQRYEAPSIKEGFNRVVMYKDFIEELAPYNIKITEAQ